MNVKIDNNSGFCFGVVYAINMAEENLKSQKPLYCLGDIVHNNNEVARLTSMGLVTINHEQFKTLKNCKVLLRAHGEPPETYRIAYENNIQLIDASCPVVLKLQNKIQNGYNETKKDKGQVVIYGKQGHAEVNGLVGQTNGNAIIINSPEEIDKIDVQQPLKIYSQTTQSKEKFANIIGEIKNRTTASGNNEKNIVAFDTVCRQVSNRETELRNFSKSKDVIVFVSGKKSSNGKILYNVCKSVNENTHFVSDVEELKNEWFANVNSVGVCGATSTPRWLMEKISDRINSISFH